MRKQKTNQTIGAFVLTRALPALLLTLAMGLFAILLLVWSAHQTDRISFLRQEEVVAHVVSQLRSQIAYDQESSTVWDTAIEKVRTDDTQWMDNNLGTWMHTYFGFDGAYVLTPHNRPIYAFANGTMTTPAAYDAVQKQVEPLIKAMRQEMRDGGVIKQSGNTLSPGVANIMIVRGHPAIVSVKPIVSDSGKIKQVPGTEYLHVAVRFLDGSFTQQLTKEYLFRGLQFEWTPVHDRAEAAYPVYDNAGKPVGYFIWHPYRPGEDLLLRVMPVLLTILALALLTVANFMAVIRTRSLKLELSERRIRHLAFHDHLTDLPNRTFFNESVDLILGNLDATKVALLYLDLDHFKQVNDTLGHPIGDKLIREFASRLRALVRDGDIVARIGGDEFSIMLTDISNQTDIEQLCARIVESVRKPFDLDGSRIFVGVSIGVALAPADGVDRINLVRKADIALYNAKFTGRGRYAFFDISMEDSVKFRREIQEDLRAALQAEEIVLHYQPIYAARDHVITGFEALLRWCHPSRGWISPEVFVPIAEESGLIEAIGEWVLHQACTTAVNWPKQTIAVNASAIELANPDYASKVANILHTTNLSPQRLEIEITETVADSHIGAAANNLTTLRELGVQIAIDDFGIGFSSLARLKQLEVDRIKIDRSFIHGFGAQDGDEAIVRAIIDLAHAKGLQVTAEGVETLEQRDGLFRIGCDDLQGFIFSKAKSASEVSEFLQAKDVSLTSDDPGGLESACRA